MTDGYLNDLSFEQLDAIGRGIAALSKAGFAVRNTGYTPRFALVPGFAAQMTLDFQLPALAPVAPVIGVDLGAAPDQISAYVVTQNDSGGFDWQPVESDPGDLSECPAPLAERAQSDIGDPAPEAAACPPASASALAATAIPPRWTDEEDTQAIDIFVTNRLTGSTIAEAQRAVCAAGSRCPFEGTGFRLRKVLAARIDAELLARRNQAALAETPPEAAPEPAPEAAPEPAPEAARPDPDLPEPPANADPLTAHLLTLPRKDWSLADDHQLAFMAVENGWGHQDIAVDLGRDTKAVKARWDALTGLHTDPKTDKPTRRFVARDVLNALSLLVSA